MFFFQLDLDNINLANDILDGSFRSASANQSGASFQSHNAEQLPDISGLDLAAGIANSISEPRPDSENDSRQRLENQNMPSHRLETDRTSNSDTNAGASENRSVEGTNQIHRIVQVTNQEVRNEHSAERVNDVSEKDLLLQRANEEKEALQKVIHVSVQLFPQF